MSHYFIDWTRMPGREVFPGDLVWPCTGNELQVTRSELAAGSELPFHAHPQEQIIVLLEGMLEYTVGQETQLVHAGSVIRIPSSLRHGGRVAGDGSAVCIEAFHPIRMDFGDNAVEVDLKDPT